MREIRHAVFSACLAGMALAPRPAAAAPPAATTDGFFIGLDVHSSHIGSDEPTAGAPAGTVFVEETGSGGSLRIGHGITPAFALRIALCGAEHKTTDPDVEIRYGSLTLDGVYHFRAGQPLRPYLFGGLGGFSIESRRAALRFETTGPGAVFGGGLLYFLGEHFALDFGLRGDLINWKKSTAEAVRSDGTSFTVEQPIEEEGSAAQFLFGASWWF